MESTKTQFGDLKVIPFRSLDDLSKKWREVDVWPQSDWDNATAYGLINGSRNGGIITIDIDTKKDVTGTIHNRFLEALKIMLPDLYGEAYIETTRSGGAHVIYRVEGDCPKKCVPAKTLNPDGTTAGLIEVLGEGQMTFVFPSPNYNVLTGDLQELPTVSQDIHKEVLSICESFNELHEEESVKSEPSKGGNRSGDVYNAQVDPAEVVELMVDHGWEVVKEVNSQYFLRRPDKDKGISATFNYGGRKQLIVFSTSTLFVAHHDDGTNIGYSPFQIIAKLKFNGNFKQCAKWLDQEGYNARGTDMWDNLKEAHRNGGNSEMRRAIPDEYVVTLSNNEIDDFVDDLKQEFGNDCITKTYLKNQRDQAQPDDDSDSGEVNDASDATLMRVFGQDFHGKFGSNEFKGGAVYILKPIEDVCAKVPAPLTDMHENKIWAKLLSDYGQSFNIQALQRLIEISADEHKFHPVRQKLAGLKWDGKPRLDTWLQKYCGAKDCAEARKMGRYFLIGAVARIMQSGVKMDNALILKSAKQGVGKSQLVNVLSYGYSVDNVGEIGSKDCSEKLQGAWFVELPELDNIRASTKERVKRWLSTTNDDEVQKYEKRVTARPRQCVFIGTTNDDHLFVEEEFRRFWPVEVGMVDLVSLRKDLDQLWAETVRAYQQGELWYSTDPTEFQDYSEHFREVHPLEDEIRAYCKNRDVVFTKELHLHIYGDNSNSKRDFSPSKMREYTPILRRLGFKGNQKHNGRSGAWKRV